MSAETFAAETEPSSNEYSLAWVAYALQATGALGFLLGPLIGAVISYARRNAEGAGYLASHHRWLIRTFWWTGLWYALCLVVIVAGAWPILAGIVGEVLRSGGDVAEFTFRVDWRALFATVGGAMVGGLGILVVWIWNWYRIVRGGFLLAGRSPTP